MLDLLIPQESYSTVNQSSYLYLYDWFTNKSTFSLEKKVFVDKRILRAKITIHNHVAGSKMENCKFGVITNSIALLMLLLLQCFAMNR